MKFQYFNPKDTLDEIKKKYKTYAFKFHPDLHGDKFLEEMKIVNNEYEYLINHYKAGNKQQEAFDVSEELQAFKDILKKLFTLSGITVELVGEWLWVSGNTFIYKDKLKAWGLFFSGSKKMWYYHNGKYKFKTSPKPMQQIRAKYGSKILDADDIGNQYYLKDKRRKRYAKI